MSEDRKEAMARVQSLRAQAELARNERIGDRLFEAACGQGCFPCYRACAVARIKLRWWQAELDRLGGDPSMPTLRHGGAFYHRDAGRC